jgi:hypothetical protein
MFDVFSHLIATCVLQLDSAFKTASSCAIALCIAPTSNALPFDREHTSLWWASRLSCILNVLFRSEFPHKLDSVDRCSVVMNASVAAFPLLLWGTVPRRSLDVCVVAFSPWGAQRRPKFACGVKGTTAHFVGHNRAPVFRHLLRCF